MSRRPPKTRSESEGGPRRGPRFSERRKTMKSFNVMLKREKVEALEAKLKAEGRTKAEWLDEKVDEELGK